MIDFKKLKIINKQEFVLDYLLTIKDNKTIDEMKEEAITSWNKLTNKTDNFVLGYNHKYYSISYINKILNNN